MADYAKGSVLIALRKKAGISRETAAAGIGVTAKALYEWEKYNGGIKLANLRQLADYYGIEEPRTLVTSTEEGGDQLQRIEDKLDVVLRAVSSPAEDGTGYPEDWQTALEALRRHADAGQQPAQSRASQPSQKPRPGSNAA